MMFYNQLPLSSFFLVLILLSSCIPNKKVVYLQENGSGVPYDSLVSNPYNEYRLQVGDIINLDVRSSNPEIAQIFNNQQGNASVGQLASSAADINYLNGYPINENGDIDLPLIGMVRLAGKTLTEAKTSVRIEIEKYILDPYIELRLGGIRYTALGEFNRPGKYSILQSNLTIFEAIANAGDLTIVANRKEITLIRQYPEGQRLHRVDLTDRAIISSPYYYIQPNDQLYVEPLKVREWGAGVGVTGFQTFMTTLSILSSIALIVVSINRL